MLRTITAVLMLMLAWTSASAVLIDSGDGTGNTTAPSPDPGWDNVGLRGALTAVYVGNSYVLTAFHVGVGEVSFAGVTHQAVPGTEVRLRNPDGSGTDLQLFSIHPIPALPGLPIASVSPSVGDELILVGNGRDRGPATSLDPNGPPPPPPIGGYLWGTPRTLRWGTNEVDSFMTLVLGGSTTETITTCFDASVTAHEGSATNGDSGGAVFYDAGRQWELAGIILAISQFEEQDPSSSLYGNLTHSGDLAFYRDEILSVIALPEPRAGLPIGIAAVLILAQRRQRH